MASNRIHATANPASQVLSAKQKYHSVLLILIPVSMELSVLIILRITHATALPAIGVPTAPRTLMTARVICARMVAPV